MQLIRLCLSMRYCCRGFGFGGRGGEILIFADPVVEAGHVFFWGDIFGYGLVIAFGVGGGFICGVVGDDVFLISRQDGFGIG